MEALHYCIQNLLFYLLKGQLEQNCPFFLHSLSAWAMYDKQQI